MKKILFMMFLVTLFLSGCGQSDVDDPSDVKSPNEPSDPVDEDVTFTVTFHDEHFTVIDEVSVVKGEDAVSPESPEKTGYIFMGWTPSIKNVTSDLLVYPVFVTRIYDIYFYSQGLIVDTWTNINYQNTIDPLPTPSREGYIFEGWYLDDDFTTIFSDTSMPASNLYLHAKWATETSLATEKLRTVSSSLGNTNGNIQNKGLVVYDFTRDLHIYSVGHSVFSYDPATDETLLLFTTGSGRAIYLNMYYDYLYYIDTTHQYLMRYHMVDKTNDVVSESEYHFLARDQSYIFNISLENRWGEDQFVLRFYKESNNSFSSLDISSVEHLNVYGVKIYYTDINGVNLQMRASSFMGHVTIKDFAQDGFDEIDQLILQKETQDYEKYIGMLALRGSNYGFYLYNTVDGLTEVTLSSNLHALNFDGAYYYYIDGLELVKVHPETLEKTVIDTVPSNMDSLYIIHHWIYYGDYDGNVIRRIHPVTLEVEVLSE